VSSEAPPSLYCACPKKARPSQPPAARGEAGARWGVGMQTGTDSRQGGRSAAPHAGTKLGASRQGGQLSFSSALQCHESQQCSRWGGTAGSRAPRRAAGSSQNGTATTGAGHSTPHRCGKEGGLGRTWFPAAPRPPAASPGRDTWREGGRIPAATRQQQSRARQRTDHS
jgi:hypothetical protein